ncbi:MAG: BCCT family transporter [Pseudomonadota bacterium]|jgi:choline/carnitine/betaine transport|uniref:BCCT family transporter n=1 Tax=Thalassovita sp. TaxID=1979401 RepID=UPI002AB2FF89|nr:BCCT family transporter [Thalassovita sp.]MEC8040432.1 BCCT family transporter [Pseudomonadota bacterium]MEC8295361.1 BCCT family transporter [Pseudomonadota bacterium]
MKPPLNKLDIPVSESGFYAGFSKNVAVGAKLLVTALIVWAVAFPESASSALGSLNTLILGVFNYWYIYAVAFFLILCLVLAVLPVSGRLRLGQDDEKPEFSNFSWFSMMFSAGIGIGMLTFATAEPIYHFQNNPNVIMGEVAGTSAEAVRSAYIWSFAHWGLSAWGAYAIAGLAFAYFSYRRNLPLTVRTALIPLFGKSLSGPLGHLVDIVSVVAIVLGIAQTLGFGVEQFVAGLARIGVGDWLLVADGNGGQKASFAAILFALLVIVGASTLSALSGVGRGIKWLSNLNMGLSFFLLAFFLIFGSTMFALEVFFVGIWDYLQALPGISFTVWSDDGTEQGAALAGWQGGWTVFYWAWWIAVTPFVGLFLARISRGRTVREFILGAMIIPSIMCFIWFAFIGGTAIDLELSGAAGNAILGVGISDQLYATLSVLLSDGLTWVFSVIVVVLLLTYLVTSADSAVLIINTINAAGDDGPKARPHIIFWGIALALVVGALLVVGGLKAIQTAMVIAALPFSFAMVLMGFALIKAIINDSRRNAAGVSSTVDDEDPLPAE